MPEYRVGDIVLVRFHPAFGKELKKYRPAVVVIDDDKIDSRFVVVVPLTSKVSGKKKFELEITHPILEKKSLLLCWYIRTTDRLRIVKKLGSLGERDILRLKKMLLELMK